MWRAIAARATAAAAKSRASLPSHTTATRPRPASIAQLASPLSIRRLPTASPRLSPVDRRPSPIRSPAASNHASRWIATFRITTLTGVKQPVASFSTPVLPVPFSRGGLRAFHTAARRHSPAAGLAFTPSNPVLSSAPTAAGTNASALLNADDPPMLFDASHLLTGQQEEKKERLRCLEVDDNGNYRHVEFSRAELGAMLELHPRDLRFLDSSMRNLPSILARRRVIIVNMELFKALITSDRVLMFDPWYPHVQSVVQPLQAAVLNGGELFEGKPVPFEFIALEHILLTVCRNLEDRFDLYIASLEPLLSSSGDNQDSKSSSSSFNALIAEGSGTTLMHLLQLKNGLTSFEVTLRETAGAMKELMDDDEDMSEMYLTQKAATGKAPKESEHGEVEVILETYFRKVDELENEVEQNVKSITLTEEHIQIRLDSNRNSMMKMELLNSISTLGLTAGALGAAIFGMNLPSHLEHSPYAFFFTSGLLCALTVAIIRSGVSMSKRRGIDLLHVEPKEPQLRFPHLSHYAQSSHAEGMNVLALHKLNKQRRLTKVQQSSQQEKQQEKLLQDTLRKEKIRRAE